jgi:hypothetical protein
MPIAIGHFEKLPMAPNDRTAESVAARGFDQSRALEAAFFEVPYNE